MVGTNREGVPSRWRVESRETFYLFVLVAWRSCILRLPEDVFKWCSLPMTSCLRFGRTWESNGQRRWPSQLHSWSLGCWG